MKYDVRAQISPVKVVKAVNMEPSSPNHLICKLPTWSIKQKKNELDNKIFHNGQ